MTNPTPPPRVPLATLALAALALLLVLQIVQTLRRPTVCRPEPLPAAPLPVPAETADAPTPATTVYTRVSPSVVSVANKGLYRAGWFDPRIYEVPQGAGSGFVWDKKGRIITNYHVVHQAAAITVTFGDGTTCEARVIGSAPDYDLAVLEIDRPAENLPPPIELASSRVLQVGQPVFAIGNPFGLDTTLSAGIVSALGRTITSMTRRRIHDVIQTDAAINPGNSGGPLLDTRGRLVGINTAILSPDGAYAGIGFAVPADTVARVVPQLIERGHVVRAGLGVQFLSDTVSRRLAPRGIAVYAVEPGGPADTAGIRGIDLDTRGRLTVGDLLLAIGDTPVDTVEDLQAALDLHAPGDSVTLTLRRGAETRKAEIRLTES